MNTQVGVTNRITATFGIQNNMQTTMRADLRMHLRQHSTVTQIHDIPGDKLVSIVPGANTFTRTYTLPRYFGNSGGQSYDVIYEIMDDPGSTGAIDSGSQNNALTIINSARISDVAIPVLLYHNVNSTVASGNWVTICDFTQQMDYLSQNHYHTINGQDVYNYIYKGVALPSLPVWISIDDLYQNIYDYAFPILQARGLDASINTNTQWMGQMNSWDINAGEPQHLHMTWTMLQALKNAGMYADAHSQHHVHLGQRLQRHSTSRDPG